MRTCPRSRRRGWRGGTSRACRRPWPPAPTTRGGRSGHVALVLLALGVRAHDEGALTVVEEVRVLRRLVTGAVPDDVFLPVARLALRVLVPVARRTGEADDDQIRPAVAVDVFRP